MKRYYVQNMVECWCGKCEALIGEPVEVYRAVNGGVWYVLETAHLGLPDGWICDDAKKQHPNFFCSEKCWGEYRHNEWAKKRVGVVLSKLKPETDSIKSAISILQDILDNSVP